MTRPLTDMDKTEDELLEAREPRIEEFLNKVQELRDEYADCASAMCIAILSILPNGASAQYGAWSVPPDQSNAAYNEIAELIQHEVNDLLDAVRHLDNGTSEGRHYDA